MAGTGATTQGLAMCVCLCQREKEREGVRERERERRGGSLAKYMYFLFFCTRTNRHARTHTHTLLVRQLTSVVVSPRPDLLKYFLLSYCSVSEFCEHIDTEYCLGLQRIANIPD